MRPVAPDAACRPSQSDQALTDMPRSAGPLDSPTHSSAGRAKPPLRRQLLRLAADASTLGVGACGLAALAWRHQPEALLLLIAAGVLDVVDGALARRAGGATDYGRILDAGSDWLAFGVAPAVIGLQPLGLNILNLEAFSLSAARDVSPLVISGLFGAIATARLIRGLWRPNPPGGYLGLPVPAAAAAYLAAVYLPVGEAGALLTVLALGWLCLSRIRYPGLTQFVAAPTGRVATGGAAVLILGSDSLWVAVGLVAVFYGLSGATQQRLQTTRRRM